MAVVVPEMGMAETAEVVPTEARAMHIAGYEVMNETARVGTVFLTGLVHLLWAVLAPCPSDCRPGCGLASLSSGFATGSGRVPVAARSLSLSLSLSLRVVLWLSAMSWRHG